MDHLTDLSNTMAPAVSRGQSFVHQAAAKGYTDIISAAKECNCNMSRRDLRGKTPLEIAIESGQTEAAAKLREYGAQ